LLQRFVSCRDEDAFSVLVERHAALVLGLSRSILRNPHDAEDIFQATFLVLARKAGCIRKGESLGSWLYAVASRLAQKTRARAGKRRSCEQQAASPLELTPVDEVTWGELRAILHEEVGRLPQKYRAAVIVCYWEGRTYQEAGQQLGCAASTVKDRLERARTMLQRRLARRGLALSAAWFAASLDGSTSAAVSAKLLQTTVRSALLFTQGQIPAGAISGQALASARKALQGMSLSKLRYGLALLLLVGVLGGVGLAGLRQAEPVTTQPPQEAAAPPKERKRVDRLGDPLPPGALLRLGTIRFRPSGGGNTLAFLPGGDTIVSPGFKGIYFWDVATGKEQRRIKLGLAWVGSFVLSPDGKVLACSEGGSVKLWEARTGKELRQLGTHAACLAFSHDGRRLASVDQKNTLSLWDWRTGKEERRIVPKQWRINAVGFGPNDRTVYAWDYQNLSAWDTASGKALPPFLYPKNVGFSCTYLDQLVLSPDGKFLAQSIFKQPVRVYETGSWRELGQFQAGKVRVAAFTPDGKGLFVSGEEGTVLWDVARGKVRHKIVGGGVSAFSPDGRVWALYRGDGAICLYDAASGKPLRPLAGHESEVSALAFSADGRVIATRGFSDGTVRLWDGRSGKPLHIIAGDTPRKSFGYSLAFSPDGSRLAWGDWEGRVHLVDPHTGRELRRWIVDKEIQTVLSVRFSPDSRSLVTVSYKAVHLGQPRPVLFQVWEAATGKESARSQAISNTAEEPPELSPDGRRVLVKESGQWLLREPLSNRELTRLQKQGAFDRAWFFAFSPDGRTLAASTVQNDRMTLRLWETISGTEMLTIPVHGPSDGRIAFSPDGRWLALGGYESIELFDVTTGQRVLRLRGHDVPVRSLCFSPDGRTLASGLANSSVLIWDLSPCPQRRTAVFTPQELEQLWADLGSSDGPKAYRALWTLAASKQSIDLLRKQLRPATEADLAGLRRLLDDLNSDKFQTRERASRELERRRAEAQPLLEKALAAKPSPEVRRRLQDILSRPPTPQLLRQLRGMQVLECLGTPEARAVLRRLAGGLPDRVLTKEAQASLARLTRQAPR
jgi:RNA polymerase sigma factor (sigma-70 family)